MKRRMMMMCVVLGVFVLVFGMGSAQAATKITMWTLFGGGEGGIMTDLIAQFNKEHPDIVVEEQIIDWGQYYGKLLTSLLANEAPDVCIMHLAVLPDYASRGVLNAIDTVVPSGFTDKLLPNIVERAKYDGKLYAIPMDSHPLVLYYNKTALKDAGLVDGHGDVLVPKTWAELLDYSTQFTAKAGKAGMTAATDSLFGERVWSSLYSQLGGPFQNPATGKVEIDEEKAAKAYEMLYQFYSAKLAPAPLTYADSESLFVNNENAYHFNGVWAMSVYPNTEGLEFGVTEVPALEGGKPLTCSDSHSLVFPKGKDDAKFQAAVTFGAWFSAHTMDWAKAGHIPVNTEVQQSDAFLNLPMRKDYIGAGENSVLAPSVKGWPEIRQVMWEVGERAMSGAQTPAEAANELKTRIEEIGAAQ